MTADLTKPVETTPAPTSAAAIGTSDNHRFDCCGVIVAHVMGRNLTPVVIEEPMRAGYLTGPSRTTRRSA